MPSMAFHGFFGWDTDLPPGPALGPTQPSYASWEASVLMFSLVWTLLLARVS